MPTSSNLLAKGDHDPRVMITGVSLAIPVRDEAENISRLLDSIHQQLRRPDEVIFVDGGSRDGTLEILQQACDHDPSFRLIKAGRALPGQGRNIAVANAIYEWIAFTDAGICLEPDWLQQLVAVAEANPEKGIVCGDFEPVTDTFFKQCAAIAYVPEKIERNGEVVLHPFIASSLVHRDVWQAAGGFPDLRAAEDLIFFEEVEKKGFKFKWAPRAIVHWEMQPNLSGTFRRFFLYSCVNVWAKRQRYWHYGVLRWYVLALPFLVLAVWKSGWWLLLPLAGFCARIGSKIWRNRGGRPLSWIVNPLRFGYVLLITLVLDLATFAGWIKALFMRSEAARISRQMHTRHGD
jgi:cellulose synthase/poly-beta-1,6-N-acetylglucosamine synthase-like glycosyltransferase